ncbi:MAG: tol-pal system YbgF family protein [Aureispira sp.]
MQQAIGFVQQAGTAFYTRHFTKAVYLLRRALQALPNVLPYPQPLRWALLDLLEMVESWYQGLPMLETSAYSQTLLQELKQWLEQEEEAYKEHKGVKEKLRALDQLLEGLWVGFDFFGNNNLSVENDPPLIALQMEANGQIQLYKCQEHAVVNQLIAEFKACFELQLDNPVDYAIALKPLLEQKQWEAAEALLQKQLEQFPSNQRLAFVSLAELHFLQEHYQQAMEAYMKAVMLGTPKDQIQKQVQTACNTLARTATDKKIAARWRQILIDFF